jgi:hypothetical protein
VAYPSSHSVLSLLCLAASLAAQSPFTDKPYPMAADRSQGAGSVTVADCKQWLYTLASPEFEGRQTGQPGFQKAADFVSAHFQKLGLEARGPGGSYFQQVPWSSTKIDAEKTFVSFSSGGKEVLRIPADRLAGAASAGTSATGDVVLLVIEAPEITGTGRNVQLPKIAGLEDLELEGKIVVVYVRPRDEERTAASLAKFAVRQGLAGKNPAAVLFAQESAPSGGITGRSGASRRAGNSAIAGARRSPLDVTLGGDDLMAMLKAGGQDASVLTGSAMTPAFTLQAEVEVVLADGEAPAMNVWAVLPGTDPVLKDEYVVIGSHLDHVGMRGGLHPGADDDGSGTTGVLSVSTMFVKNKIKPKRSILFV